MIKKREAQGLPLNVIVLAVLALIVLVILVTIFSKQSGKSIKTLESCEARGGECRTESEGCTAKEYRIVSVECPKENPVCCVKIFEEK